MAFSESQQGVYINGGGNRNESKTDHNLPPLEVTARLQRLLLLLPDHSAHAVKLIDLREAVVSSGKFQVMFDDCTLTVGCKRAVTSSGGRL